MLAEQYSRKQSENIGYPRAYEYQYQQKKTVLQAAQEYHGCKRVCNIYNGRHGDEYFVNADLFMRKNADKHHDEQEYYRSVV